MTPIDIRPCSVTEMEAAPNLAALLSEYGEESAIDGMGQPDAQFDTYSQMEALGVLFLLGAWQGDELIGFLVMVISTLPHYGKRIASTESYFVTAKARSTGAGLKLLYEAEQMAKELDAIGFFVSAPIGSRLDRVLTAKRYRETNRVFFKALA